MRGLPICAYEAHKAHSATYPSRADEYGGYFGDALEMGATMMCARLCQFHQA